MLSAQVPAHTRLSRRRLLATAGALGAAGATGLLSGCGGALPVVDTAASGFGQGGSGLVEVWCRSATQTGIQFMADAFNAAQQRIRVRVTPIPDTQFVTKLATAIRGRRVPDLVDFDDINSTLFAYRGAFADVTDLIKQLPGADQLSPGHLALATKDGRNYAVPFLADNSVLFCNTELFEKAGVDLEASTTDFEGLLEAARKITALGGGVKGWTYPGNNSGAWGFTAQPHIWAAKTDLIKGTVGNQTGNVEGNEAVRATLNFLQALWQEKLVPPGSYADDASTWGADYAAGTIGMFPASYGVVVPKASKETLARTKIVLLPGPTGGRSFFDGGNNLCLLNGARNASAAWEFAAYAVAVPQQTKLPDGGYTPVRADVVTDTFRREHPFAVPTLLELDKGYAPTSLAYNVLYNQSDGPWLTMLRRAVFDGQTEAAMAQAQVSYDRLLQQAQA
ncbi:multiple sugar transport system substrate-binding protein [Friedmanniella endophytica]|uniref:Multiple sugar transport system substrate-binding protein n=1 Tax=Microlunatus kandeliicorticis TaxID=1759536 RepID=A0A7W3INQ8_9ACTN|nr:sugar ABC transporter substrate-binding protein [Microlunatus kandeliicorticis]MBA8792443.1 multiple sugar transport system substrate-binding protein [Microlunatus kandeliicorticis]